MNFVNEFLGEVLCFRLNHIRDTTFLKIRLLYLQIRSNAVQLSLPYSVCINVVFRSNSFVFVALITANSVFQFVQMRSNASQFSLPHSLYINLFYFFDLLKISRSQQNFVFLALPSYIIIHYIVAFLNCNVGEQNYLEIPLFMVMLGKTFKWSSVLFEKPLFPNFLGRSRTTARLNQR